MKNKPWTTMFFLGLAFIITACTAEATSTDTLSSTLTDGEAESPSEDPACPAYDFVYQLDYTHQLTLDRPGEIHLELTAAPDSAFYLTIRGDGTIDSGDFENAVPISFTGTVEDCDIEGVNMLYADIFGLCSNGIATMDIDEHFDEGFIFTETCPEGSGIQGVEQMVSAPEDQFDFDLSREMDTKVLEMDTGMLSFRYTWTLHDYGPAIVPLVPTSQD